MNALSAFMAHTLPTRDLGTSDVHVEIHVAPAMQLYGTLLTGLLRTGTIASRSKLEIGEPAFDRAIDAAASGVSEELIAFANDLDTLTIDSSVLPDQANAKIVMRMKGQQSWTVGTLASAATRAAAPPPMFWHLPASSSMAGYQYPADAHRFDAIRHTLSDLLDGWLAHEGISVADRAPLTTILGDNSPTIRRGSRQRTLCVRSADISVASSKKGAPAATDTRASRPRWLGLVHHRHRCAQPSRRRDEESVGRDQPPQDPSADAKHTHHLGELK